MAINFPVDGSTLACYRFAEMASNAAPADSSGNGYNLAIQNTTDILAIQGLAGRARCLVGSQWFQQSSAAGALLTAHQPAHSLTYEAVFFPRALSDLGIIASFTHTGGGSSLAYLYYNQNRAIFWGYALPSGQSFIQTANNTLTLQEWHYIAGVREWTGTQYNLRLYLDGALIGTTNNSGTPHAGTAGSVISVGGWPATAGWGVKADIDQVRISSVVRSAGDISTMSPLVLAVPSTDSPDTTGPTIANFTAGGSILSNATLSVDVTDAESGVELVVIWAVLDTGVTELVYNGSAAASGYSVSTTNISNGKTYQAQRTAGFHGSLTIHAKGTDNAGNTSTASQSYTAPAWPPVLPDDDTAPVISILPANSSAVDEDEVVSIDVTDTETGVELAVVSVTLDDGTVELAYDGVAQGGYTVDEDAITNGFNLEVSRDAGLFGAVSFQVKAIDGAGNVTTASASYTAPEAPPPDPGDVAAPTVSVVSPPANSALQANQPIVIDVTDVGGLRRAILSAEFTFLDAPEVVHDGSGFSGAYAATSERSVISNGFRYSLLRKGSWPEAPVLRAYAFDTSGNEA